MSLLGFLFERNKNEDGPNPESAGSPESVGVAGFEAEESIHGEPNIDQIREELAEIAKLIGPGDSYDLLAETDMNMTSVDITMGEIKKLIPQAFNAEKVNEVDDSKTVTVLFSDLFDQLQSGEVEAPISQLVVDIDDEHLADNFSEIKENKVALPLQVVVNSVRPEELSKRTTKVERDPELADMPDVFSLPSVSDRGAAPAVPENRMAAEDEAGMASDRGVVPFTPSPTPAEEAAEKLDDVFEDTEEDHSADPAGLDTEAEVAELPEVEEEQVQDSGLRLVSNEEPKAEEAVESAADATLDLGAPVQEEAAEEAAASSLEVPESVQLPEEEAAEEVAESAEAETSEAPSFEIPDSIPLQTEDAVEEVAEEPTAPAFEIPESIPLPAQPEVQEEPAVAEEPSEAAFGGFEIPDSVPLERPEAVEAAAELSPSAPEGHPSLEELDRLMKEAETNAQPSEYNPPVDDVPAVPQPEAAPGQGVIVRGLDVNVAHPEDLVARFDGIGPKLAVRIVEDREINGRFTDPYDLARVQGIGRKIFESITGLTWREDLCGRREILSNILDSSKDSIPDIKGVSERVAGTKGFEGCVIAHSEGYVLASSWDHSQNEALGAFAPQMYKKVVQYIRRLELGEMDAFTFFFEEYPVTLVNHGDIYLAAIHSPNRFSRRHVQIARALTAELSRRLQRIREF